ncbi:ribosome maturation factor RimP [Ostreibacterium oceani]|uniref:Ribosome maturation factor RimP n=1 Tax=Ostreibacterium oceani TaxID=2654998 RepID=A0A6N7EWF3_9GAMM|nr:ribosome maturation factor RimP [Ostreibacterium oceani]MPV85915.1 ribosome maturation factor RimP [Ostreibacterium oceani]
MQKNEKLTALLAPTVNDLGYELVGVAYHPNSVNALLRVYIDKEGGVNLDDCMAVNRQVSAVLDVEDPIASKYTLEISSPGLDRPLFSLSDFEKFIGKQVKIRLTRPIERQRNFKGRIQSVAEERIVLAVEKSTKAQDSEQLAEQALHFNDIESARLVPEFD